MEYAEYRPRPVEQQVVEAMQFVIEDDQLPRRAFDAAISMTDGQARLEVLEDGSEILTLHYSGDIWVDVDPGSYIIRHENGRYFVVAKAVFEKVYEPLVPREKPKRVRRTKAQIEFDALQAAAEAAK